MNTVLEADEVAGLAVTDAPSTLPGTVVTGSTV